MMKQTTPSTCKLSGGRSQMHRNNQLHLDAAEPSQGMSLVEASFHEDLPHFHPSPVAFSHSIHGDGCSGRLHTHPRTSLGSLDHSSSSFGRHLSAMVIDDTFQIPNSQAPPPCISPEGLLEIIISAQQKLQQLQAVVELMVRAGGPGQDHQSLTASVISIVSQLVAATACLHQQPSVLSSGFSLSNEGIDLRFDGLFDSGLNHSVSAGRQEAMTSPMKLAGMRKPSMLSDCELQPQAMELVSMKSGHRNGQMEPRFKDRASNALFDGPHSSLPHSNTSTKLADVGMSSESLGVPCHGTVTIRNQETEDQDFTNASRDDDDDGESENLPPGSYELVEMAATEILAEHAHFCEICGKGFKRDANLRMHMRGHGDEYKTPAALARPGKSPSCLTVAKPRRYSCPFMGCKRNKQHKKFQPLKTTLCVKNHYRRSHCPKLLTCSKCKVKKFSVVADLKTHEKHCGQDKWQCSCGTTFSRKDKLTGHVNLFTGHVPLVSSQETDDHTTHNELSPLFLTNESVEGLENHRGSKTTRTELRTKEQMPSMVFETANNSGTSINDLINMDEDIFRGDRIDQHGLPVHDPV